MQEKYTVLLSPEGFFIIKLAEISYYSDATLGKTFHYPIMNGKKHFE